MTTAKILACVLLSSVATACFSQQQASVPQTQEQKEADALWRLAGRVDEPLDGFTVNTIESKYPTSTPEFWLWFDRYWMRQRVEGIKFWNKYPNDKRRYKWLAGTVWCPPNFWKDPRQGAQMYAQKQPELAVLDQVAIEKWRKQYVVMRAELMASPDVEPRIKQFLRTAELIQDASAADFAAKRGESIDPTPFVARMIDVAETTTQEERSSKFFSGMPDGVLQLARSPEWEAAMLNTLQKSPYVEYRNWATGRQQVAKLRGKPLDLELKSMTGSAMKTSDLRGKVVLVDIWSNTCASCIEAMPKLRELYDKYRAQGFEIYGIWLGGDDEESVRKARNILKQQNVNWPNGVLQGNNSEAFGKQYSITGVPITWLLDKNGLLVTNEYLNHVKLEARLQQLLGPGSKAGK